MNYYIQTFGCQMNQADSEKINMILMQSGFKRVSDPDIASMIIMNTCSVRKKGEDRVYSIAHDQRKKDPKVIIGLTGCMVRKTGMRKGYLEPTRKREPAKVIELLDHDEGILNSDDKIFGKTDVIDFVFRIEDLPYLTKILSLLLKRDVGNDEGYNEYLKIRQMQENAGSANIVIQTGCDNFCTYCIVPHTRGRERSRAEEEILNEISEVAARGTKEIILLGQNVNSYGKEGRMRLWDPDLSKWGSQHDFKTPFRELLEKMDTIRGIDRIRFTSSNPHDMTKDILDAHFDLKHTCNYLHLALQSGDNDVLRRMNRKHSYEDFKAQVEYLRAKDGSFSISTDLIVGFPGETREEFENTVRAMEEIVFDFAYIARYSERATTYASKHLKDDVTHSEKARRWHMLNGILAKSVKRRAEMMIGRMEEVIIGGKARDGRGFGRTRNFKEVFFDCPADLGIGDTVRVKISEMREWVLEGKLL